MNNLRLLEGLLSVTLLSVGVCSYGQSVISLEKIFETAEANSAQLRSSFTAQSEAEQAVKISRTSRLPDITASLSASYLGDGFTTDRKFGDYRKAIIPHLGNTFSLGLQQPLYTGGAITGTKELAELKLTASRFATDLQRDNIRFRLTGFYLDLYKCTNLRHVIERNLSAAEKVLEEMRARHEQGTVLQNDITRYELLVSNLELQLVKIDNTISLLNANLVTVAGLPDGTVVVPDSTLLARSLPAEGEHWWQQEARTNSPSLSLARSGVDMNRKAEKIVRSERLPRIGLQAGWTLDGPILVEVPPINRNLSYWYVGVGVSYNVSSLYKSNKSLAKSRAATQRSMDELAALQENISLEVKADYTHYLEAYEELKTQQKSVELARSNYNTVAMRYSSDMALITDMLDAANVRLDAEKQLTDARINIIYYYYKLLFVTGKI